jgi:hypothetical protein
MAWVSCILIFTFIPLFGIQTSPTSVSFHWWVFAKFDFDLCKGIFMGKKRPKWPKFARFEIKRIQLCTGWSSVTPLNPSYLGKGLAQEHPPIKGPLSRNDLESLFLQNLERLSSPTNNLSGLYDTVSPNRVTHNITLCSQWLWGSFHPLTSSFSGICKVMKFVLNLSMKCWNSASNAHGSTVVTVVVHVWPVKIYVAEWRRLGKRNHKNWWFSKFYVFSWRVFKNLILFVTKLRVLVLCFSLILRRTLIPRHVIFLFQLWPSASNLESLLFFF